MSTAVATPGKKFQAKKLQSYMANDKPASTKRVSKPVEKFVAPVHEVKESRKTAVTTSSGPTLGDMKSIADNIGKFKGDSDELRLLHTVIYNSKGQSNKVKTDLKKFGGFDKSKISEEKIFQKLMKGKVEVVKKVADILCVEKKTSKEETAESIAKWLLNPSEPTASKSVAPSKKRKSSSKSKAPAAKKAKTAKKSEKKEDGAVEKKKGGRPKKQTVEEPAPGEDEKAKETVEQITSNEGGDETAEKESNVVQKKKGGRPKKKAATAEKPVAGEDEKPEATVEQITTNAEPEVKEKEEKMEKPAKGRKPKSPVKAKVAKVPKKTAGRKKEKSGEDEKEAEKPSDA